MIRILHVIASMNLGGAETFIMNIYRNIDRSKIQFDFLVHTSEKGYYDDEIRSLGGYIYNIPSRREGIIKNKKALYDFFREHKEYKIVHQHSSSLTYIEPIKIAKRNGVQTRIIHGHNIRQSGSKLHKYIHMINKISINKYATHFFACSTLASKWMYKNNILNHDNCKVINNAIDVNKFTFSEDIRASKRNELDIKDKFVIGNIARFHAQKNHEFLIDIFYEVYKKNKDAILLLIGDGKNRLNIESKVKELNIEENVRFMGNISDVSDMLQAMDIFLFPSIYEGLGIVLVEAQSTGLKCFTSDKVVPNEVNVTDLVEFIDLSKPANFWADMILKNNRYDRESQVNKIIKGNYEISNIVKELQECYYTALENN